jgi:ABC-type nitrate/sulfonate/bicarbonate transport system ATPase subunit
MEEQQAVQQAPEPRYGLGELILSIKGVRVELGGNLILRDVNLSVRNITRADCIQGQIVALLGPSGRGKTQLFRRIAGLDKPTAGEIRLGPEQRLVDPGTVGVVFQDYTLFEHMTVRANLETAGAQTNLQKDQVSDLIGQYLEAFSLTKWSKHYPAQLSGGQRQRVAIMQQLIRNAANPNGFLLLMDEPFSGLSPEMVEQVCNIIVQVTNLNEMNTTIVVTHDVSAAVQVADMIILLGLEKNEQGLIPGATIVETVNLAEIGLSWRPDIMDLEATHQLIRKIKMSFREI